MGLLDQCKIPSKLLFIYIIVDGSQNMEGAKIGSVNDSIENIMTIFPDLNSKNLGIKIVLKVLLVNDKSGIVFDSELNGFIWQGVNTSGDFYFGRALSCLTDDVIRNFHTSNCDPIFILLTSSPSKDSWEFYLRRLYNVNAFEYGHKIAIAVGNNVDLEMLRSFTNCDNHIIKAYNIDSIKNLIRVTYSYPEWEACDNDKLEKCKGDIGLIIDQAVSLFGKDVLCSSKMINILNDYHAFASDHAEAFIFKTIQRDPHFKDLINSNNWYLESVSFCERLSNYTGIDNQKLQAVIDAIGFGLNQTIYKSKH